MPIPATDGCLQAPLILPMWQSQRFRFVFRLFLVLTNRYSLQLFCPCLYENTTSCKLCWYFSIRDYSGKLKNCRRHSKQIFLLLSSSNQYLVFQQFYPTDGFILGSSHNEKHENTFTLRCCLICIYNVVIQSDWAKANSSANKKRENP